jgi:hypothetical protein
MDIKNPEFMPISDLKELLKKRKKDNIETLVF